MTVEHEALDWLIRVNDPAFTDWDDWERWLAADPRHGAAYWRLAEVEADAVEALSSAPHAMAAPRPGHRTSFLPRRVAFTAAAAAAVVVLGGVWFTWSAMSQPRLIETAPGESRALTLADGSRVSLDGSTRLAVNRRDPRDVTLQAGRALFDVVHDEADPFVVTVGDTTLTDLGTIFDVTRLKDGARVAVSEGAVRVDARAASAILNPGDSVLVGPQGLDRRRVAIDDVASWRGGRLSFSNETLAVVAQDIERVTGVPITVAPTAAKRRFTGSLAVRGQPSDLKSRLSTLLGVSIVDEGEGWRLEP